MTVYVALLHSIILGVGRRVVMNDLRAMTEGLGFRNPRTLVATGNLIFEAPHQPLADIETKLESAFTTNFGKHVDIIARDADGWRAMSSGNPFLEGEGGRVVVRVMRKPLVKSLVDSLDRYRDDPQRLALVDGDLWIDFAGKPSETRLLSALMTKRLGIGTLRNWNTVSGLTGMLGD